MKTKKLKFFFLLLCILQLFYIFYFRSGFKYEIIKNPLDESSGLYYSLKFEVIQANDILKRYGADDFNLSENIKKDTYLYQRFIEFHYPIRINKKSQFVFFLNDEEILMFRNPKSTRSQLVS